MDKATQKLISSDCQIKKFSLYGFLKNLKFFEPYLLIYLLSNNISMLQIGVLYSIREIIVNIFEIPSGVIADNYGRKKSLCMCFIFYTISFVFFYLSKTFYIAVIAMAFFGLGEAFRSGTHKAMIYTYLDRKGWQKHKTFVYGKTRSWSLRGSAASSLLGIAIILNVKSSGYIFIASTLPYIIDFFLILSYPSYLDKADIKNNRKKAEKRNLLKSGILTSPNLRHILLGEGFFEAIVSTIKDFIQPILKTIIIGTGVVVISGISAQDNLNIILGLLYMVLNLLSSKASQNAYRLKDKNSGSTILNLMHIILMDLLLLLGIFINYSYLVCAIFLCIYLVQNIRKPIYVDEIDSYMNKNERATILSIASQLKSLIIIIIAPLTGYVFDNLGMNIVMYALAAVLLLIYPITHLSKKVA